MRAFQLILPTVSVFGLLNSILVLPIQAADTPSPSTTYTFTVSGRKAEVDKFVARFPSSVDCDKPQATKVFEGSDKRAYAFHYICPATTEKTFAVFGETLLSVRDSG